MYLNHFGLDERPFDLSPDPRYLFMTSQHSEALANLEYGLSTGKAITLLLGEAGTGKTTLLRAALKSERCKNVRCVQLTNSFLTRAEFLETLARGFDLSSEASQSKAVLLAELETLLKRRHDQGETTALVVDEAQRLSEELLEEIRLLANIETDTIKLLPLVLAGQPELGERLNSAGLRQLKQRVALRCDIAPFELRETASYIVSRVRTAGGQAVQLFTREAVMLVHECSRGIPRTINVVCDNALLNAFAAGRTNVDRSVVQEVARDFDLAWSEPAVDSVASGAPAATPAKGQSSVERAPEAAPPAESSVQDRQFLRFRDTSR